MLLCWLSFMLNGINAECRKQALYAECRYAECRGAFIAVGHFHPSLTFEFFQIPPEIISVDEALLLRFKSDDTINAKGFSAAYVVIDEAENFDYQGPIL